jgi:hypothetical protein
MMNIETAFKKPFSDIKKLIMGILLSIVPIVSFFASGYILECSGIGKKKSSNKMPEWKNFEYYFVKGFFFFCD